MHFQSFILAVSTIIPPGTEVLFQEKVPEISIPD